MGALWYKTEDGWKTTIPYGRATAGWTKAVKGYRKTAPTVWTDLFTTDFTPPAVPIISSVTVTADLVVNQGRLSITIKAPATADVAGVRVKVGKAVSANNTTDANYIAAVDGTGKAWSEWDMTPNQSRTKTYPMAGNLTNGATYYVTAWAMDKTRNYSGPVNKSIKYATPDVITHKNIVKDISPTDSRTTAYTTHGWSSADKFLRTGDASNLHGLFFYSNQIPTVFRGSLGIVSLDLQIQRYPSGNTGSTRFKLFTHKMENQSNINLWSPSQIISTGSAWYTANQNQTLTIPVPPSWYGAIIDGRVKGFGILSTTGIAGDINTGRYYGFGTFSGRLHAVYRQ